MHGFMYGAKALVLRVAQALVIPVVHTVRVSDLILSCEGDMACV